MASVETLGSVDVVCAGKTNSLTKNDMKVDYLYINSNLYKASDKIINADFGRLASN